VDQQALRVGALRLRCLDLADLGADRLVGLVPREGCVRVERDARHPESVDALRFRCCRLRALHVGALVHDQLQVALVNHSVRRDQALAGEPDVRRAKGGEGLALVDRSPGRPEVDRALLVAPGVGQEVEYAHDLLVHYPVQLGLVWEGSFGSREGLGCAPAHERARDGRGAGRGEPAPLQECKHFASVQGWGIKDERYLGVLVSLGGCALEEALGHRLLLGRGEEGLVGAEEDERCCALWF
jgi:hypothetical protein